MSAKKPRGVKKPELTRTVYDGRKVRLKVGDCVLVNSCDDDEPYIGRIKDIVQRRDGSHKIRATWFYRPEEAVGGRRGFHGERELFESDHWDWFHEDTIVGPCVVANLESYQALTEVTESDFFSRFRYKPARREFSPNRVPVYCVCEEPYNPDRFMVGCDRCEDWFHPECLNMGEKDIYSKASFICDDCVARMHRKRSLAAAAARPAEMKKEREGSGRLEAAPSAVAAAEAGPGAKLAVQKAKDGRTKRPCWGAARAEGSGAYSSSSGASSATAASAPNA